MIFMNSPLKKKTSLKLLNEDCFKRVWKCQWRKSWRTAATWATWLELTCRPIHDWCTISASKYYNGSIVKHNYCVFYCYVKMFLQEQHVSTQLRGHHQAGTVMRCWVLQHSTFICIFYFYVNRTWSRRYTNCLCIAIFNFITILAWWRPLGWGETCCSCKNILT
jgi:hypothetical protein